MYTLPLQAGKEQALFNKPSRNNILNTYKEMCIQFECKTTCTVGIGIFCNYISAWYMSIVEIRVISNIILRTIRVINTYFLYFIGEVQ